MTDQDDLSRQRFPWLRSGFDLEGWVGAVAALLVGFLLGILWGPLSFIGFAGALIILFATRTAERAVPSDPDAMVAPCDGMVVSIGGATPPDELRLEGTGWTRIRLSSAPFTANGVHAPMGGEVDHIIRETGDPAAFMASKVDTPGLAIAYLALTSGGRSTGFRLATGGLGPRLEIDSEAGDAVRAGRTIGTRRLGGWCDLYVPQDCTVSAWVGQTVIGAETILARFTGGVHDIFEPHEAPEKAEPESEPVEKDIMPDPVEESLEDTDSVSDEPAEVEDTETVSTEDDFDPEDEEDVSEMFARLRKEAQKVRDEGGE